MIDIRESNPAVIDNELYDEIHLFAALDFEVRKYKYSRQPCQKGSKLERIRFNHERLSKIFQDKLTIHPIQLPDDLFGPNYKVTYQGEDYLLDKKVIVAKIHLLR